MIHRITHALHLPGQADENQIVAKIYSLQQEIKMLRYAQNLKTASRGKCTCKPVQFYQWDAIEINKACPKHGSDRIGV